MTTTDPKLNTVQIQTEVTLPAPCAWCGTPMTADNLGDQMHPGCGDPLTQPTAVAPEDLGPCAVCGAATVRYGDRADSTLCPTCQDVTR